MLSGGLVVDHVMGRWWFGSPEQQGIWVGEAATAYQRHWGALSKTPQALTTPWPWSVYSG